MNGKFYVMIISILFKVPPKYVLSSLNCDSTFQANSVKTSVRTPDQKSATIPPFCDPWDSNIYRSLVCVPDSSICTTSPSTLTTTASMDSTAALHLSCHGSLSRYFGLNSNNPFHFKLYDYRFFWNESVLCICVFKILSIIYKSLILF